jgi:hypothetical protein
MVAMKRLKIRRLEKRSRRRPPICKAGIMTRYRFTEMVLRCYAAARSKLNAGLPARGSWHC